MKASDWIKEIQKMMVQYGDLDIRIGSTESMPQEFNSIEKWEEDKGGSDAPYFVII
jgi:hypothetical protein